MVNEGGGGGRGRGEGEGGGVHLDKGRFKDGGERLK